MENTSTMAANQALFLLLMFVAVSMILGGFRGGRWATGLVLRPVRGILRVVEGKIAIAVTALVFIVLGGYGILGLIERLLHP